MSCDTRRSVTASLFPASTALADHDDRVRGRLPATPGPVQDTFRTVGAPTDERKPLRQTMVEGLLRAVDAIAAGSEPGAVLVLEAEPRSLRVLMTLATPVHVDDVLTSASQHAVRRFPRAPWGRTSWNRYEFVVVGERDALAARAKSLVSDLLADDETKVIDWRAVLTRVVPGDARRTVACDPGYDLADVTCSAVIWVDPYPHDDWQQSQRYPTISVLWRRIAP